MPDVARGAVHAQVPGCFHANAVGGYGAGHSEIKARAGCNYVFCRAALPPEIFALFPGGFNSEKYYDWERGSKWEAHSEPEEQRQSENGAVEFLTAPFSRKSYPGVAYRTITGSTVLRTSTRMRDPVRPPAISTSL